MVEQLPQVPPRQGACAGCGRPSRTADGDGCAPPAALAFFAT
jgi:hypothetical protein